MFEALKNSLDKLSISKTECIYCHASINNIGLNLTDSKKLLLFLDSYIGEKRSLVVPSFPFGGPIQVLKNKKLQVLMQVLQRKLLNVIEDFVNFGCIATGIVHIIAVNFHSTIWKCYRGWLRTITSIIPTEETVQSDIQQELFYNFCIFNNTAIYRLIISKSSGRKHFQQGAVT